MSIMEGVLCSGFSAVSLGSHFDPGSSLQRLARRGGTSLEDYADFGAWENDRLAMDSSVRTAIRQSTNKQMEGRCRSKDRSDRATVETVLDPRTRMVRIYRGQSMQLCISLACVIVTCIGFWRGSARVWCLDMQGCICQENIVS